MPIALTVFGVGKPADRSGFCYALIRSVRGPGEYPNPTLPAETQTDGITRTPFGTFDLELVAWDQVLDEAAAELLQADLSQGRFVLPRECPVDPGHRMDGPVFGPLLVDEDPYRLRFAGIGSLYVGGIAVAGEPTRFVEYLSACVGKYRTAPVLAQLIELLATETGLGEFFKLRRRLGVVERAYRFDETQLGTSLAVQGDKPNPRTREPMRRVQIRRNDLATDQALRLHTTLRYYDDTLEERLADMPAGMTELKVEAANHVTDVEVTAFNESGQRVDRISAVFLQAFDFGLTARGQSDQLPPPFQGSPESPDLETRPRLNTSTFTGPAAGDRAGALDALRKSRLSVNQFVGVPNWKSESRWFDAGLDNQIEVIRWIKAKLESPLIAKAILIDPFLGTAALQRVIARHGHENIDLTIVISPGHIDPDADEPDANGGENYISRLVATATEWSNRLCGSIRIIHVQRGQGRRQAFHDRYLILINKADVPEVFLLSNSLSKAAGIWPFAISEMDRPISWQIRGYIQNLIDGSEADRDLTAEVVWQSPARRIDALSPNAKQADGEKRADWLISLDQFAAELWAALSNTPNHRDHVMAATHKFMGGWPKDIDVLSSADALFELFKHRLEMIVWMSSCLDRGGFQQQEMALRLDYHTLERFLASLPPAGTDADDYLSPIMARDVYFSRLGAAISRGTNPTNYVRSKLNPALYTFVQTIETQRGDVRPGMIALRGGVCLVNVGLQVAIGSAKSPIAHRVGVAIDYIHWFGRLIRSEIANAGLIVGPQSCPSLTSDVEAATTLILKAREVLGSGVDDAIARVSNDSLALPAVKDKLLVKVKG